MFASRRSSHIFLKLQQHTRIILIENQNNHGNSLITNVNKRLTSFRLRRQARWDCFDFLFVLTVWKTGRWVMITSVHVFAFKTSSLLNILIQLQHLSYESLKIICFEWFMSEGKVLFFVIFFDRNCAKNLYFHLRLFQ